jgi:hypothetical protein
MQSANRRRGMRFHLADYTRATGHSEVVHIDGEGATRRNILGRHEIAQSKASSLATPSTVAHVRFADHSPATVFDPKIYLSGCLTASDYAISLYLPDYTIHHDDFSAIEIARISMQVFLSVLFYY